MSEYRFKPKIISGVCKCGHSWEDHHLGCIINADIYKYIEEHYPGYPMYVAQECEFYGCNENGGQDENGEEHCYGYEDKDYVEGDETRWYDGYKDKMVTRGQ